MEADFQQGCRPLQVTLLQVFWLTNSEKKKKKSGLSKQLAKLFNFYIFFFQISPISFSLSSPVLYDILSTILTRSFLTCN